MAPHVNASCFSNVLALVAESGFEQQNKRGPVAPHKRSTQALNSLPLDAGLLAANAGLYFCDTGALAGRNPFKLFGA